jgi:transcriptional regulator with XRE-family HTH domain
MPYEFWTADRFHDPFASRHIGKVLRAFRTDPRHEEVYGEGRITQNLLGSWLGLGQHQLSRIENGRTPIDSLSTMIEWARKLSIPQEFLWFEYPPNEDEPRHSRAERPPLTHNPVKKNAGRVGLATARKAVGLTQEQLAERLHVDRSSVIRWEAGGHKPVPYMWPKLAKILGVSRERLAGLLTQVETPTQSHDDAPSATPASHLDIAGLQSPHVLANLSMFTSGVLREPADSPSIAAIRAMSDSIQMADRKLGGGKLYLTVTQYLRSEIAPYFLDPPSDCSPSELFSAAASMTEIAGWMAHDGGNNERARAHFANAYRLARAGENSALSANVCASLAHLAIQLDFPDDAERIASTGLQHVTETDGAKRLVARLHTMRARAYAMTGRETECLTNLGSAHESLASERDGSGIEWIAGFDEASLASESALCFLALGSLSQAEKESRKVIELRAGDRVRSRALGQLTLAAVLVREGAYDEAARVGVEICNVARELNSARVHLGLSKLGEYLTPHSAVSDVAEFLTIQTEVCRKPAPVPNETRWPA